MIFHVCSGILFRHFHCLSCLRVIHCRCWSWRWIGRRPRKIQMIWTAAFRDRTWWCYSHLCSSAEEAWAWSPPSYYSMTPSSPILARHLISSWKHCSPWFGLPPGRGRSSLWIGHCRQRAPSLTIHEISVPCSSLPDYSSGSAVWSPVFPSFGCPSHLFRRLSILLVRTEHLIGRFILS